MFLLALALIAQVVVVEVGRNEIFFYIITYHSTQPIFERFPPNICKSLDYAPFHKNIKRKLILDKTFWQEKVNGFCLLCRLFRRSNSDQHVGRNLRGECMDAV